LGDLIKDIVENALKESFLWDEVKDELKKPATRLSAGQQQTALHSQSGGAKARSDRRGVNSRFIQPSSQA
jgi:hypothetical protein